MARSAQEIYADLARELSFDMKSPSSSYMHDYGKVRIHLPEHIQLLDRIVNGDTALTDDDLVKLIAFPSRIRNHDQLSSMTSPQFLADYTRHITPFLNEVRQTLIAFSKEEVEAAEGLKIFWKKHGHNIRMVYDKHGHKVDYPSGAWKNIVVLKQLMDAAEALNDGPSGYDGRTQWSAFNPDQVKLREVLNEALRSASIDPQSVYASLSRGAGLLKIAMGVIPKEHYKRDVDMLTAAQKDYETDIGNTTVNKLKKAKDSLEKSIGRSVITT